VLTNPARTRAAWDDVLARVRQVPGVASVATVDTVPMRQGNNPTPYWTNAALPPEEQMPLAIATTVSPDYLKVMGIRLRQGRFFNDQDRADGRPVIVIDEVLAKNAFGRAPSLGNHLWIPWLGSAPFEVVGVVEHVRYWGPAADDQAKVRAQFYSPFSQLPDRFVRRWSELMSIAVRTTVPPLTLVPSLRRELRGATNDQVIYQVRTMEQLASASVATQRFLMLLFSAFAGLALLLACIGIYGVLAYLTGQRVPEFGVRMALGATAADVVRLVFRQSLGMIAGGVAAGAAFALAADRILTRSVEGVETMGPATFAAMVGLLMVAALLASFVPARRAGLVDPMRALRQL